MSTPKDPMRFNTKNEAIKYIAKSIGEIGKFGYSPEEVHMKAVAITTTAIIRGYMVIGPPKLVEDKPEEHPFE